VDGRVKPGHDDDRPKEERDKRLQKSEIMVTVSLYQK
jgi:hypothetical protein